jgi:hypothetical protein
MDLFADQDTKAVNAAKAARPRRKRRPKPVVADTAPVTYTTGVDNGGRTTWTLTFPAPDRMLSGNVRVYWRTRHALTASWRQALAVHAKAAKLPRGLSRVRIDFVLRFPDKRGDRDALNYYPLVVKPAVDGLGPEFRQQIKRGARAGQESFQPGHGLIADDTPAHLDGPHIELGPKVDDPKRCPFGQIILTITDLGGSS